LLKIAATKYAPFTEKIRYAHQSSRPGTRSEMALCPRLNCWYRPRESTVSVTLKTTLMNGRIGNTRCVATTHAPLLRENAASAKSEK